MKPNVLILLGFALLSPTYILLLRQSLQQAQYRVQQGWVVNMDELIAESMRRSLKSHRKAMTEQFIREDVDWGLHGAG